MTEKKTKPEIRFKGFDEDWVKKKLADVSVFSKGIGYSKNDLVETGVPIILYGRLYTKYQTIISAVDTFVFPRDGSTYSEGNEVVVPASGETAEDIARASAILKKGILIGGDLNIISPKDDIDSIFLAITISTGKPKNELSKRAQGKSIVHLRNSDLKEICIQFPCKDEQTQIGNFFNHLDTLITLHQRKYDKLTTLKTAMLEKMFPKAGSDVPEIRFKEFTGKWEKRKLGEIAVNLDYGLNAAAIKFDGINKYIRITDIDDENNEFKTDALTSPDTNLSSAGDFRLKEGDLLFARTGASVGKTYFYKISDGVVFFAGFLIRARIKPEYDPVFIFQNTLTNKYKSFIRYKSQRSGQPGVNAQEYSSFEIFTPILSEQAKIGAFFKQLDNLLSLQQKELEKLKTIKKACLEKMFV